ncbi:MAG TPA: hypothetical protein PKD00_00125 [Burkholderiales bacterium]|nr:hypothetical protein [Burkholderiales bacterium]
MGLHTYFYKSKELYDLCDKLYNSLDDHESGKLNFDEIILTLIRHKIEDTEKENKADYINIFKTKKRDLIKGGYTNDVIYSKEECFEWLKNNKVTYINDDIELATNLLNEFWDKYPHGVISFD